MNGLINQPQYIHERCPFCHRKLGRLAFLKRKMTKICKCSKCGRIIDERHIHW